MRLCDLLRPLDLSRTKFPERIMENNQHMVFEWTRNSRKRMDKKKSRPILVAQYTMMDNGDREVMDRS